MGARNNAGVMVSAKVDQARNVPLFDRHFIIYQDPGSGSDAK